jgi:hypothetical protein
VEKLQFSGVITYLQFCLANQLYVSSNEMLTVVSSPLQVVSTLKPGENSGIEDQDPIWFATD